MRASRDAPEAEDRGRFGGGGRVCCEAGFRGYPRTEAPGVAQVLGSGPPSIRGWRSGFNIMPGPRELPS